MKNHPASHIRNCFVTIHYHLTKVSARINKLTIGEPSELSITLPILWFNLWGKFETLWIIKFLLYLLIYIDICFKFLKY